MSTPSDLVAGSLSSDKGDGLSSHHIDCKARKKRTNELFFYIQAHTRHRKCCRCGRRLYSEWVRYKCRECHEASLCGQCGSNDPKPGRHDSEGQKIDLSRMDQIREDFVMSQLALHLDIAKEEKGQRYLMQLIHQLGLPENFCRGCLDIKPGNVCCSGHPILLSDLRDLAEAGCATCSMAYRGLLKFVPARVPRDAEVQLNMQKEQIKVDIRLNKRRSYLFRANPGHPRPWNPLSYAQFERTSLEYYEEKLFATIRSWIRSCETNHQHEQCGRQRDALLPRRVVCIHPNNDSNDGTPMLSLQESHDGALGKYIALSHCWGMERVLRTTQTNLFQLRQSIDFSGLPLTFRDAVRCAQLLGIKYLWIDSLCIIQDDVLDWEMESAKMSSIYHDAYLVIAAGASSSDKGGMLFERPDWIRGKPLESKKDSGVFDLVVQEEIPHASHQFPLAMIDSPISSRAWCMQELILSRRSVSFFKEEVIWECNSYLDCECGEVTASNYISGVARGGTAREEIMSRDGIDSAMFGNGLTDGYKVRPYSVFLSIEFTLNQWRNLTVPAYTARKLSKPEDRLPAAAGMASLIARRHNLKYLAGLWSRDLKWGLMWFVPPCSLNRMDPAPDDYIAPSFSWASVNREIVNRSQSFYEMDSRWKATVDGKSGYGDVECELVESSIEPNGANALGCVKVGSYLLLRSLSIRLILRWADGMYSLSHSDRAGEECSSGGQLVFYPDCPLKEVKFQTANDPRSESFRSVNRSKTTLELGMCDGLEAEVDALLLANVLNFRGSRNCFTFIVLGLSQSHDDSYERLGFGEWNFADEEVDGEWMSGALRRDYKVI